MPGFHDSSVSTWLVALFVAQGLLAAYAYTLRHVPVVLAFSVVTFACGASLALGLALNRLRASLYLRGATAALHFGVSVWLFVWQNAVLLPELSVRAILLAVSALALLTALTMGWALAYAQPRCGGSELGRKTQAGVQSVAQSEKSAKAITETGLMVMESGMESDGTVQGADLEKGRRKLESRPTNHTPYSSYSAPQNLAPHALPGQHIATPTRGLSPRKSGSKGSITASNGTCGLNNKPSENTLVGDATDPVEEQLLWLVAASMAPGAWYDTAENWMAPRPARAPTKSRSLLFLDARADLAAMRTNFEAHERRRLLSPRRSIDTAPSTILEHSDETDPDFAPRPFAYASQVLHGPHDRLQCLPHLSLPDQQEEAQENERDSFGDCHRMRFASLALPHPEAVSPECALRAVHSASAAPSLHTYREPALPSTLPPLSRPSTPLNYAPSTPPPQLRTAHSSPIKKVIDKFRALLVLPPKTHRALASVATAVSFSASMTSGRSSRLGSRKALKALFVRDSRDPRPVAFAPGPPSPVHLQPHLLPAFDDHWDAQTVGALDRLRVSSLPTSVVGEYDKEKWRTLKELERRAALAASLPSCI